MKMLEAVDYGTAAAGDLDSFALLVASKALGSIVQQLAIGVNLLGTVRGCGRNAPNRERQPASRHACLTFGPFLGLRPPLKAAAAAASGGPSCLGQLSSKIPALYTPRAVESIPWRRFSESGLRPASTRLLDVEIEEMRWWSSRRLTFAGSKFQQLQRITWNPTQAPILRPWGSCSFQTLQIHIDETFYF
ncbi:hypothetical protein ABW21_db0204494 [Orbilia brochopaga]|nr:hypothetical protein ABW21_db0204494 [Drechslerella brochopaga]